MNIPKRLIASGGRGSADRGRRPRGVRRVWFTAAGALAMFVLGRVEWRDAVQLGKETGAVLAFREIRMWQPPGPPRFADASRRSPVQN